MQVAAESWKIQHGEENANRGEGGSRDGDRPGGGGGRSFFPYPGAKGARFLLAPGTNFSCYGSGRQLPIPAPLLLGKLLKWESQGMRLSARRTLWLSYSPSPWGGPDCGNFSSAGQKGWKGFGSWAQNFAGMGESEKHVVEGEE